MTTQNRSVLNCISQDGKEFVLTEISGTAGSSGGKQFTLPNGHIVNALQDGTYRISASGEILRLA